MTDKTPKEIQTLIDNGYQPGNLASLPNDISNADRKRVEEWEAERANEVAKTVEGEKPVLHESHVELNPNQYGYAERNPLTNNGPQVDTDAKKSDKK